MGLKILSSNHLHVLFNHLANHFKKDPLPPTQQEWIVVQSRGMARWLNLALAKRLGIAASIRYELPKAFCFQLTSLINETQETETGFQGLFEDRQKLSWALHACLPPLLNRPAFKPVSRYLAQDSGDLKRFQLASRTADCFDNYQLYRPTMLEKWTVNQTLDPFDPHEAWQRDWWQAILQYGGAHPLFRAIRDAQAKIRSQTPPAGLPRRISLFGVGSLPPLFLEFLHALAQRSDVSLYVVNPSEDFWGDVRTSKENLGIEPSGQTEFLHFAHHELLASLGRQGRDFFNLLQTMDSDGQAWYPLAFPLPERNSLLHHLQADMAELIQRGKNEDHAPIRLDPQERSLQIHACHGPLREMEVLRDLLLAAFEEIPSLKPQDVVVLVPDIHNYAPFIQAVFANPGHPSLNLPFSIADQRISDEMPLTQAILALVETATGRMTAPEVMSLFEVPAIRRRFQISDMDVDLLNQWVLHTRIAWAEDGKHRAQHFDLPEFDENSWRIGLDRMLLSYAMGTQTGMVSNLAPLGQATTSHAALLGHFSEFIETLFSYRKTLAKIQNLPAWAETLSHLLLDFFQPDSPMEEEAMQVVRNSLGILPEVAQAFKFAEKVGLQLVLEPLRQLLKQEGFGSGFITGRITFCALKPMRTIPFKVVCIAGLNDGDFPRRDAPFGFDLMAKARRLGDRNIREDDRFLFLESLLAAEERLILSYVGHQPGDLEPLPPSSVLQELLAYLDRAFLTQTGQPISQQILVHHPVHPFDKRYFDPQHPKLFSFDAAQFQIANTKQSNAETPFFTEPLQLDEPMKQLAWATLTRFWIHPVKYFCETVLGIRFPYEESPPLQAEPLEVDGLLGYELDARIFDCLVASTDQTLAKRLRSEGLLPPGQLGDAHFAQRQARVSPLVEAVADFEYLPEKTFHLKLSQLEIDGSLSHLTQNQRVVARPSRITPRSWVSLWLDHLILQILAEQDTALPQETLVLGLDKGKLQQFLLTPFDKAHEQLAWVLEQFQEGHRQPLPLFGKTSFAFAESHWEVHQPKSRKRKISENAEWAAGFKIYHPLCEDPYIRLCFEHDAEYQTSPPKEHQTLALRFWEPMFACRREVS